jgi:hypothetical protein
MSAALTSASETVGSCRNIGEEFAAAPDFNVMGIGQKFGKGDGRGIAGAVTLDCPVDPTGDVDDEKLVANHSWPPAGDDVGVVNNAALAFDSTLVTVRAIAKS